MVFGIIVGAILLLIIITILFVSLRGRHNYFGIHYYDKRTLKYFYASDFDNLECKEDKIIYKKKDLKIYLYQKNNINSYKGIIVFVHGLGPGHIQYTTEIDYLCSLGYKVLTFDCIGTGNSGGKKLKGYTTSLLCLNEVIKYMKNNEELSKYSYILFGHSMGGYAVDNIIKYHSDMKGIVSLSSFNTTYDMYHDFFTSQTGMGLDFLRKLDKFYDYLNFGKVGMLRSIDSLKETKCNVLLVSGDKDTISIYDKNFLLFKEELNKQDNIYFLEVKDRGHRPLLTLNATEYEYKTVLDYKELQKEYGLDLPYSVIRKYYDNLDYNKLVEMDKEVLKTISEFINNCFNN